MSKFHPIKINQRTIGNIRIEDNHKTEAKVTEIGNLNAKFISNLVIMKKVYIEIHKQFPRW